MLYQELPPIESTSLDGWGRWLAPTLIVSVALTAAALLFMLSAPLLIVVSMVVLCVGGAALAYLRTPTASAPEEPLVIGPDYALLGSALGLSGDPVALTTG